MPFVAAIVRVTAPVAHATSPVPIPKPIMEERALPVPLAYSPTRPLMRCSARE